MFRILKVLEACSLITRVCMNVEMSASEGANELVGKFLHIYK